MLVRLLPVASRRNVLLLFRSPVTQFSRAYSDHSDDISERLQNIPVKNIRNFCIIAHVDHGKSTLADRLLENTGAVSGKQRAQMLDNLKVEQERGITVKAQTASLFYKDPNEKQEYLLNLIDTPGHVDFCNEVYRSLSAADGAILLVDANHGIQAQTVSNYHLAKSKNLKIIPVLNKIDLKNANPKKVAEDLVKMFGFDPDEILKISAKMGLGVDQIIPAIIKRIPPPVVDPSNNFRALIFDGWYDRYRGALSLIYVKGGELLPGQEVIVNTTNKSFEVKSVSLLSPAEVPIKKLTPGQVGMIGCNIRNSKDAVVGDTIFLKGQKRGEPCSSFQKQKPMVFAGVYPLDQSKFTALRSAIEKMSLNDSAVTVQPDSSAALGQGWRLGFLGLLHMEVFCQRLEQEHEAESIITNPSVTYKVHIKGSKMINHYGSSLIEITNPALLPSEQNIEEVEEPTIAATIICPDKYLGHIMGLCIERRGQEAKVVNIDNDRLLMTYVFPLNEVIVDFYDKLKSLTSGYASFDYQDNGYQSTNIVRMNILLNGVAVDELTTIVHVTKAKQSARELVERLRNVIPRQMVEIAIQAMVGGKVLARENIKAYRKDVTAKLYGGDVTRRMKLLRNQAEGKKKMRSVANINVPKDAFITLLRK